MVDIKFPKDFLKRRYGKTHISFFVDYLMKSNLASIKFVRGDDKIFSFFKNSRNIIFSFMIDGNQVIIDYSDHSNFGVHNEFTGVLIFKFHFYRDLHGNIKNVFPIGPSLIYSPLNARIESLNEYLSLRGRFNFIPGDKVINMQEPKGNATERRRKVQSIISGSSFGCVIGDRSIRQLDFWVKNENSLVSVCVPGANNDMLDRGQYELMGLGVCTLSPRIKTILPWDKDLVPGEHYVSCANDYSDLVEKIEWCRDNKDECKRIGDNCKSLFDSNCVPDRYFGWILKNVGDFYEKSRSDMDT